MNIKRILLITLLVGLPNLSFGHEAPQVKVAAVGYASEQAIFLTISAIDSDDFAIGKSVDVAKIQAVADAKSKCPTDTTVALNSEWTVGPVVMVYGIAHVKVQAEFLCL